MRGIANNIKESTNTEGTIALVLEGASTQFFTIGARFADGDRVFYSVAHDNPLLDEAEGGLGTYDVTTDSISRDVVFWSTNADALVNFSAGSKTVICTAPAEAFSPIRPVNDFRLTLTTGTPVTITDVAASSGIYLSPYSGNQITLFDGTRWRIFETDEISLAFSGLTAGKNYDVFGTIDTGSPILELGTAWTDDVTRAVALARQDGTLIEAGDATRRYLGSVRAISATEICDTERRRFNWNNANRVKRKLKVLDTTDSWTYSLAAYRQANGNAANQLEVLVGVVEEFHTISALNRVANSTSTPRNVAAGIGINSTTENSADLTSNANCTSTNVATPSAQLVHAALGYTYYAWLEYGAGADTQTWIGDSTIVYIDTGMIGSMVG
jgi:hypothetical protein